MNKIVSLHEQSAWSKCPQYNKKH